MNTCGDCKHWYPLGDSKDSKGNPKGECRIRAPRSDRWPRTRNIDGCGEWSATRKPNTLGPPPPPRTKPQPTRHPL